MPKKTVKKALKKTSNKQVSESRMTKNDPEREKRIDYEIVVDAYDEYERATGWYYSLQDTIEGQVRCPMSDVGAVKHVPCRRLKSERTLTSFEMSHYRVVFAMRDNPHVMCI